MDPPNSLVANAQDALGIGHQQQVGAVVPWLPPQRCTGLAQDGRQAILLIGREIHPQRRTAVGLAEALNGLAHGWGINNRHYCLDVVGQKAVEQDEIALP